MNTLDELVAQMNAEIADSLQRMVIGNRNTSTAESVVQRHIDELNAAPLDRQIELVKLLAEDRPEGWIDLVRRVKFTGYAEDLGTNYGLHLFCEVGFGDRP